MRVRYIAAETHALLFVVTWAMYIGFAQPMANGPCAIPFYVLLIADLPISFPAFGVLLTNAKAGPIAALLWLVLGTAWWFGIGKIIDGRIRAYKEKRGGTRLFTQTVLTAHVTNHDARREWAFAVSLVAALALLSLGLSWNGPQGHFDQGEIRDLTFAPDDRAIFYVRVHGKSSDIEKIVLGAGSSIAILKNLPCGATSPSLSPDGKYFVFACETITTGVSEGFSEIFITDANGTNLHPLFPSSSNNRDFSPHFSADGTQIYFERSNLAVRNIEQARLAGGNSDIYSASLDGKDVRQLTQCQFDAVQIAFSKDRSKFLVAGGMSSAEMITLHLTNDACKSAGTFRPIIRNAPQPPIFADLAFANNGESVFFMSAQNGKKRFDYDIYRADLSNNTVEEFTSTNGYSTNLAVSNDNKTGVFLRWTSGWGNLPNLSRVCVLDLATKRVTPLNVTGRAASAE